MGGVWVRGGEGRAKEAASSDVPPRVLKAAHKPEFANPQGGHASGKATCGVRSDFASARRACAAGMARCPGSGDRWA